MAAPECSDMLCPTCCEVEVGVGQRKVQALELIDQYLGKVRAARQQLKQQVVQSVGQIRENLHKRVQIVADNLPVQRQAIFDSLSKISSDVDSPTPEPNTQALLDCLGQRYVENTIPNLASIYEWNGPDASKAVPDFRQAITSAIKLYRQSGELCQINVDIYGAGIINKFDILSMKMRQKQIEKHLANSYAHIVLPDGKIFIFANNQETWLFDFPSGEVTVLNLPQGQNYHSNAVQYCGSVYVFAATDNFVQIYCFDIQKNSYRILSQIPKNIGLFNCCVFQDRIYLMGETSEKLYQFDIRTELVSSFDDVKTPNSRTCIIGLENSLLILVKN